MANPCYEPLDFRIDILEAQEPYQYTIEGFEEILVEGVPITRNCLHESCFEIEVARGFLKEAFSSDFNDIYFYVGSIGVIVVGDYPTAILLFASESTKSIGSTIDNLTHHPIITKLSQQITSTGIKLIADISKEFTQVSSESSPIIGSIIKDIENNNLIMKKNGNIDFILGMSIISSLTSQLLEKTESTPSVGSTLIESETGEMVLSGLSQEIYHVIRDTLETLNLHGTIHNLENVKGGIEPIIDHSMRIEVSIEKDGKIEMALIKNGIVEFVKTMEGNI